MASNINPLKPTAGQALTQDVRDNFSAAKTEIEELQQGTSIVDGAVTDAKIGQREPNQAVNAVTGPGTLTQVLSWFAHIIQKISGETNWFDDPAVTLKAHVGNVTNPHSTTYQQTGITDALTAKAVPLDADLIPLLDSAAAPAFTMKKLSWLDLRAAVGTPAINIWDWLGECKIDQQAVPGTAYVITAGAGPTPSIDGWRVSCTGANVTAQRSNPVGLEFINALRVNGAVGVTNVTVYARCPGEDAYHFINAISSIMFSCRNSLSLQGTWTLGYANVKDNFAATTVISTGTVDMTDAFVRVRRDIAANANVGNGLEFKLSIGALTSGTFEITGLDQGHGPASRNYPHRMHVDLLTQCQHFYFFTTSMPLGYTTSATNLYSGAVTFPTTMRVTPTLAAGASYTVGAGAAGTPAIAAGAGFAASPDSLCLSNSGAAWNVNVPVAFTGGFDARL